MDDVNADVESSAALVYRVERPVFSEEHINTQLHKKEPKPKPIRQRLAERCR